MIRLQQIQDAFLSLVGWEQHYKPAYQLDGALTQSESGLTYQGAHPMVTLENLRSVMPDDWNEQYPSYEAGTLYEAGSKVTYGDNVYKATESTSGVPGEVSSWELFSPLSDYVERLTRSGINALVNRFIADKQTSGETRTILERRALFDGAARLQSVITPNDSLVGLEIVPVRAMGVTTCINHIGLQMTGATGEITMYLYHSSQVEPVGTYVFNYTSRSGGFQWFTPENGPIYLPYVGDGTAPGGSWYLVYDQGELPTGMRALNIARDWSAEPCSSCNARYAEDWKQITKYLLISPFATRLSDGALDPANLAYTRTVNYGINLEITVGCDLTDFIIRERGVFASALQKQVASDALRTIALNPSVRVNRNQLNATREEMLYEIDGNPQGRQTGLLAELEKAYKALSIDTRGIDRICLQCNNHGVKYRSV